jgi:cyclic pyranopterin phosphate synthase
MLVDRYGRTITYLRISVTDKCNYRCTYCMPAEGVVLKKYDEILRYEEIEKIVRAAAELGVSKIRLTGGEPLVKKNIIFLVERIAAIAGIAEINMTTNGSLLTPGMAHALKRAGMTRVNISLDTLNEKRFAAITRGGRIADVFQGIFAAKDAGLDPVKINMVIFADTAGGEIDALRDFCGKYGLILQTIKHFSLYDKKDPAGALSADRPPRCKDCNRLRITADGFIKPCLFSSDEIRIDFANIKKSLRQAVLVKPVSGHSCKNRTMCQIGG